MLWGCVGCCQIGFMRLIDYKNDLVTKHSYHIFIMQICMMNIFVACFIHTSCSRLIQPVEVYTKWYMMWCLKKDMFCKEHIFLNDLSFLKWSVRRPFFGQSGRRLSSSGHVPHGTRSYTCAYFVHT